MYAFALLFPLIWGIASCFGEPEVKHSDLTIPLRKVDDSVEHNFVRQVHSQRKRQSDAVEPIFLQVGQQSLDPEILLHDQVIASKKLATYFGEISVGKNPTTKFRVLFDTGSCEFWVPDETCLTTQCANHVKYRKSSSFEPRFMVNGEPSLMDVEYLSGKLQGYDGYETVGLGNEIFVPHQSVGFATVVDIPLLKELEWDGIVGLGFKNNEIAARGASPLIETIVDNKILTSKNLANQFSYFLTKDGGAVTFGGADLSFKRSPEEEFMWVPVDPSNSYWTVKVMGVRKEPQVAPNRIMSSVLEPEFSSQEYGFHNGGRDSIVDTGTYLIYAPDLTMENYLSDLHVESCDDKRRLPNLVFQLQGNPKAGPGSEPSVVELVLTPEDYVLEFEKDGERECLLGIAADGAEESDQLGGWTFGQVFLRSFYTVFDRDHLQIGFVRTSTSLDQAKPISAMPLAQSIHESAISSHHATGGPLL